MAGTINNVLLTGEPGVGKTTIIMKVVEALHIQFGGFFTQEIRSGKTRKGYELITLSGDRAILAHAGKKSSYKVGRYGVDLKVLTELAVPELKRALSKCDAVLIDEIGKMECYSMEFRDLVQRCLDAPKPVFGSMQNIANPFINTLNNRTDIVFINVTESNRDALPENIMEVLRRITPKKTNKKIRRR